MKVSFTLAALTGYALAGDTNAWKQRSVYQVLTDRFARTDGSTNSCNNLSNYCGGTFQGLENQLDYIKGMGFDAIWFSHLSITLMVVTMATGPVTGTRPTATSALKMTLKTWSKLPTIKASGLWSMSLPTTSHQLVRTSDKFHLSISPTTTTTTAK